MIDRTLPRDLITAHPYAGDDHASPWELAELEDLTPDHTPDPAIDALMRRRYAEPSQHDPADFPGCVL